MDKFISVEISKYAPLNPDTTAQSVPINAYFEIIVCKNTGTTVNKSNLMAKTAPTVILSGLLGGDNPLFASNDELTAFVNSLILSDTNWSKNATNDGLKFIYNGKTLSETFRLEAYSDSFNSRAKYTGKAEITVATSHFTLPGAFNDNYKLSAIQAYVPRIISFTAKDLQPTEIGDYVVPFDTDATLLWEISGDSLKSPKIALNGGIPQTVSPDTPVLRNIKAPSSFKLSIESNKYLGLINSRTITFGISTPPGITTFKADKKFCLAGNTVKLNFKTIAALNCTITSDNSKEQTQDVLPETEYANVSPSLKNEENRKIVYTLTASGSRGKVPVLATAIVSISVSRWETETCGALPNFNEHDGIVDVFKDINDYYCFAGGSVWKTSSGIAWEKLSELTLPNDVTPCKFSYVVYGGFVYVVGGMKEESVYLSKYNITKKTWSASTYFGPTGNKCGGAFAFLSSKKLYWLYPNTDYIEIYNYNIGVSMWRQIGILQGKANITVIDTFFLIDTLYIAAACEDGYIYIYKTDSALVTPGTPLKIKCASLWVKLMHLNGRTYVFSEGGMFDVSTGEQEDMMFDKTPKLLAELNDRALGIDANKRAWSMEY